MKKEKLSIRVDIQVSLLVGIMTIISCSILFLFLYKCSYKEMLRSLEERTSSIVKYIDERVDNVVFDEIKTKDDMSKAIYKENHEFLHEIKEISSIKYLYTVIYNEKKEMVYHIDGLCKNDPDFRNVGDLIEPDFQEDLKKTFISNTPIIQDDILRTKWGDVFLAYYPLHSKDGKVVGVIGIEFSADEQYNAFESMWKMTLMIIIATMFVASFISFFIFRRISNPHFKDLANTDSLTNIKNRNAFEVDINNLVQSGKLKGCALIVADLNRLKFVNDNFGHKMGDFYIKSASIALNIDEFQDCILYRIGGDEFAIIFEKHTPEKLKKYKEQVKENIVNLCKDKFNHASISMGEAICKDNSIEAWEQAQSQADLSMYEDKKDHYNHNKTTDRRVK